MYPKRHWICFGLLVVGLSGCGQGIDPEKVYRPEAFQGKVDTSLKPTQQAQQEAVRRLFAGLQEGFSEEALHEFVPGIEFGETYDKFMEGAEKLARWEFAGAPQGNDVRVVLFLQDPPRAGGDLPAERRVERTYLVAGSGKRFSISRK